MYKHYFNFGIKTNGIMKSANQGCIDWNEVRNDVTNPAFSIEKTRIEYEDNCNQSDSYKKNAKIIAESIKSYGNHVCSIGVGKGVLEYHLKQVWKTCKLCCAEYDEKLLSKLRTLFTECDEYMVFDLKTSSYAMLYEFDTVILYRVSTECDYDTWKTVFLNMSRSDVENIVFVPTLLATLRTWIMEMLRHFVAVVKNEGGDVFCGFEYSEKEFISMFSPHYNIIEKKNLDGNLTAFFLRKKL